jgi:23S rRNA (cytidine1920-2'-O)/16S rRNA (cytidine1409-2'-O)-methyltransferase
MRADQLLVQQGLAPTRSAAQRLIDSGGVRWLSPKGWLVPKKAGEDLPEGCTVEVTNNNELRFVSRGGLKLEGALKHCGITAQDLNCLDVGQSTGGFTDALLQQGARRVVGIDVGRSQLSPSLAANDRVQSYEGLNARDVRGSTFEQEEPTHSFDLIVADLSFISLTLVLPTIAAYLAPNGQALLLVKPQFELQPVDIGKGGLVKSEAAYPRVEQRIREACAALSLNVVDYFASPIEGGDGNREFFVHAKPC